MIEVTASVVLVAPVAVMFWNAFVPEKVLLFARSVELAAVTVIESPLLKVVPFTVPREPVMRPEPIEVVATTTPCAFVERRALVRPVKPSAVVVALFAVRFVVEAVVK